MRLGVGQNAPLSVLHHFQVGDADFSTIGVGTGAVVLQRATIFQNFGRHGVIPGLGERRLMEQPWPSGSLVFEYQLSFGVGELIHWRAFLD